MSSMLCGKRHVCGSIRCEEHVVSTKEATAYRAVNTFAANEINEGHSKWIGSK